MAIRHTVIKNILSNLRDLFLYGVKNKKEKTLFHLQVDNQVNFSTLPFKIKCICMFLFWRSSRNLYMPFIHVNNFNKENEARPPQTKQLEHISTKRLRTLDGVTVLPLLDDRMQPVLSRPEDWSYQHLFSDVICIGKAKVTSASPSF